jgi:hypothetical protein
MISVAVECSCDFSHELYKYQKTINIQEMISLYAQKIEWQQLKTVKVEP